MEITFKKTGNFWFDSAIQALYRTIRSMQEEREEDFTTDIDREVKISLGSDGLVIEGEEKDILEELEDARQKVVESYLRETRNFGWIFAEGEFQTYQRRDFKQYLKNFFTGKTGKPRHGALSFPKKESDISKKGFMDGGQRVDFISFKENHRDKKLADKGYLEEPPIYEFGEPFSLDFLKKGKYLCAFSEEKVKKAETVNGLHFPFLTGTSGEMNFASNLQGSYKIASKMAFLSLFAFQNIYFSAAESDSYHYFTLGDDNLADLDRYFSGLQKIFFSEEDWRSNFPSLIKGTVYSNEALLNFLISLYAQLRNRRDELLEDILVKRVYTFNKDKGIFRAVTEYNAIHQLFSILNDVDFDAFRRLAAFFSHKVGDKKYDTTYRDRLASDILNFRSVSKTIEHFLGSVKLANEDGGIQGLNQFIETYTIKIDPNMNEEKIKLCKSLGFTIGSYSFDAGNKRLLYSIRNARKRADFIKVLNEAQFKIADHYKVHQQSVATADSETGESEKYPPGYFYIKPEFFEYLPDDEGWEEYKSLVSVFAMNFYLQKLRNRNKKSNDE